MQILVIFGILLCTVEAQSANTVCCSGSGATVPTKLDATTCKPTDNGAGSWVPMTCSINGTSCQPYTCVVKAVGITVSTTYYQSCATAAATASTVANLQTGSGGNGQTCYTGTSGAAPTIPFRPFVLSLVFIASLTAIYQSKI